MWTEYIKFDKYSITLSVVVIIFGVIFSAFYICKEKEKRSLKTILCIFTLLLEEGMVVFCDMRLVAGCLFALALVMYAISHIGNHSINIMACIASGVMCVSAGLICACVWLCSKYFGAVTIQTVVACTAMEMDKSGIAMMLLVVAALVSVAAYFVSMASKTEEIYKTGFMYLYLVAVVWNIFARCLPCYIGNAATNVVMYGSFIIVIAAGIQLIITKNSYNALKAIPVMITGFIGLVMSGGYNLTAWAGLVLVVQLSGLVAILILNYMAGRRMYVNLMCMTGLALAPAADVAFKLSIFRGFVEMVEMQWNMLMGVSIIIIEIAIGKWILGVRDVKAKGARVVTLMVSAWCVVIGIIPVITQYWIYPMMSQTEMMIANISVQEIPTLDIVISVCLVVVMTAVPIIPIAKENNIFGG